MTVTTAAPVRLDFDDYALYADRHPDDSFELLDGVIYKLAPEGDSHKRTRSALQNYLSQAIDMSRFTPYTEMSFPAPSWADGPKPDNVVVRGAWLVDGRIAESPTSETIVLAIEVSSSSRPKDERRAVLYARPEIPEYWLVDLRDAQVIQYSLPSAGLYQATKTLRRGETLQSSTVDGLSITIDFLLQLAVN